MSWWLSHNETTRVLARHSYGPGSFEYQVGATAEDSAGACIVREDKMASGGWDAGQRPLYPQAGALAHDAVPRGASEGGRRT